MVSNGGISHEDQDFSSLWQEILRLKVWKFSGDGCGQYCN